MSDTAACQCYMAQPWSSQNDTSRAQQKASCGRRELGMFAPERTQAMNTFAVARRRAPRDFTPTREYGVRRQTYAAYAERTAADGYGEMERRRASPESTPREVIGATGEAFRRRGCLQRAAWRAFTTRSSGARCA